MSKPGPTLAQEIVRDAETREKDLEEASVSGGGTSRDDLVVALPRQLLSFYDARSVCLLRFGGAVERFKGDLRNGKQQQ
ncbi:hypothetical protein MRX96_049413 [Rhipicephalus microplus]